MARLIGMESCGLNTHSRGIQKAAKRVGRSPGFKYLSRRKAGQILITVARPRGILTRFPILPAQAGHLNALKCKEQFV